MKYNIFIILFVVLNISGWQEILPLYYLIFGIHIILISLFKIGVHHYLLLGLFILMCWSTLYFGISSIALFVGYSSVLVVLHDRNFKLSKALLIAVLLFMIIHSILLRGNSRYIGVFESVNLQLYLAFFIVTALLGDTRSLKATFLGSVFILYFLYLSDSRSGIILLVLFLWDRLTIKNSIVLVVLLIPVLLYFSDIFISERMLNEEASFNTRYYLLQEGINEVARWKMVPAGFGYSTDFAQRITNNPIMHLHNDLITMLLDTGLLGCIYFFILTRRLFKLNLGLSMILAYISSSLHGYLFLLPLIILVKATSIRRNQELISI